MQLLWKSAFIDEITLTISIKKNLEVFKFNTSFDFLPLILMEVGRSWCISAFYDVICPFFSIHQMRLQIFSEVGRYWWIFVVNL